MQTENQIPPAGNVSNVVSSSATAVNQLLTDPARQLYSWWLTHHHNGPTPRPPLRSAFDITDHPKIAGNLFLIRRLGQGEYDYRIVGEGTRFVFAGRAALNKVVDELLPGFTRDMSDFLDSVCEKSWPQQTVGLRSQPGQSPVNFEGLDCPLVNAEGIVSHIIGVVASYKASQGNPLVVDLAND